MKWPLEFRHPLFVAMAGLYALFFYNRRWGHWELPAVLNAHLADVLALPLLLTVALWFMRRLYFRQPAFVLPFSWVASTWLLLAVCFEGVLPLLKPAATADPLDVVAYAVGGLVFWRWLNHPA
ncbi:hypothetical protein MTX78_12865 [Hymenobacter tibetensis]|uniref:Magnesium citrate secondary transporter n=1 Tax=Hymenobacter tibetensis TaxID=497967 RepID=A0ABY4CVI0_9BACT|nr:hypothetical protein [Hymenobacter tibetensis]UOG73016.1 hypothetical protein MTX78_12865 [Hymenobacter tibetensis]